jgi:hypothetical protein
VDSVSPHLKKLKTKNYDYAVLGCTGHTDLYLQQVDTEGNAISILL